MDEEKLIESAKVNPEKFGELYDKYIDEVYRYIFRRVNNKQSAEDLTSKTFTDALKNITSYQHRGAPFSCWLYRIARNNLIDWYRKNNKVNIVSIDENNHQNYLQEKPNQIKELSDQETKLEIKRALELLDEEDREIIILKYFEELSNQEIAEALEMTANHIGVKLFRALKKLRNHLNP